MSLKTIGAFAIVLILLVAGFFIGRALSRPAVLSPYSAVYMASGDMYFGKFSRWPHARITDAWHLDRGPNGEAGLSPMSSVAWGPGPAIQLNEDQIIFWVALRSDSPLVQALKTGQAPPQDPAAQPPVAAGTTTTP